jgi:NTE family protein
MTNVGYALSGGGARGIAHLGVLKFLDEMGVKPIAISGASAGAIVGALYAAGQAPEQILEEIKKASFFGWTNIGWRKDAVFSMDSLRKLLVKLIGDQTFDALPIRLFVATTDILKGNSVIFSSGKISDYVIASSSIPGVFEPVKIDSHVLVDGGVLNNFPVEPLLDLCDVIIGSHVNRQPPLLAGNSLSNAIDIMDRCFHLAIANTVYSKSHYCKIFIDHPLPEYHVYDLKSADKIFESGYNTAKLCQEQITAVAAEK